MIRAEKPTLEKERYPKAFKIERSLNQDDVEDRVYDYFRSCSPVLECYGCKTEACAYLLNCHMPPRRNSPICPNKICDNCLDKAIEKHPNISTSDGRAFCNFCKETFLWYRMTGQKINESVFSDELL
jgi:hypothetical protein